MNSYPKLAIGSVDHRWTKFKRTSWPFTSGYLIIAPELMWFLLFCSCLHSRRVTRSKFLNLPNITNKIYFSSQFGMLTYLVTLNYEHMALPGAHWTNYSTKTVQTSNLKLKFKIEFKASADQWRLWVRETNEYGLTDITVYLMFLDVHLSMLFELICY